MHALIPAPKTIVIDQGVRVAHTLVLYMASTVSLFPSSCSSGEGSWTLQCIQVLSVRPSYTESIASLLGLPHFYLPFAIHNNTWEWKISEKQGRPGRSFPEVLFKALNWSIHYAHLYAHMCRCPNNILIVN